MVQDYYDHYVNSCHWNKQKNDNHKGNGMKQNEDLLIRDYLECANSGPAREVFDSISQMMSNIGYNNMMFTSFCEEHTKEKRGCTKCISENACGKTILLLHLHTLKCLLNKTLSENHDVFKVLNSMRSILMAPLSQMATQPDAKKP